MFMLPSVYPVRFKFSKPPYLISSLWFSTVLFFILIYMLFLPALSISGFSSFSFIFVELTSVGASIFMMKLPSTHCCIGVLRLKGSVFLLTKNLCLLVYLYYLLEGIFFLISQWTFELLPYMFSRLLKHFLDIKFFLHLVFNHQDLPLTHSPYIELCQTQGRFHIISSKEMTHKTDYFHPKSVIQMPPLNYGAIPI